MNKHILIMILAAAAILLTAGCRRIDPVGQVGDLDLVFSTEAFETKAGEETSTLQNGGLFKNLLVVLVKNNDTDRTIYWDQRNFSSSGVESGIVRFRNVKDGTYDLFAFANTDISLTADGYWKTNTSALTSDEDKWKFVASVLGNNSNVLDANGELAISSTETAKIASNSTAMLLTSKGQVTINGSSVTVNGSASGKIALHRIFSRLRVEMRNNSPQAIIIKELRFGAFKPSSSYLFGQTTSDKPVVPSGVSYSPFAKTIDAGDVIVAGTIQSDYFATCLYESYDANYTYPDGSDYDEMYRIYATVVLGDSDKARLRFLLDWDDSALTQSVTVTKVGTDVSASGAVTDKWLYYNDEYIRFHETGTSGKFEVIVDNYDLAKGFLISADGTLANGKRWGGNGLKLKLGESYSIHNMVVAEESTAKTIFINLVEHLGGLDEDDKPKGSILKKIDLGATHSNKATPIDYLRRNQDFNVVLNVYSGSSEGNVAISVEDWDLGGGSHTFK